MPDDDDQQDFKEALEAPACETRDGLETPLSEAQDTKAQETEAEVSLREAHPFVCTLIVLKPKTQSIWKESKILSKFKASLSAAPTPCCD